jgi:Flp pilus assembly protein TadG
MRKRRRGSTLVEFTLVGIPMMFVVISIFEMSRGMWNYHTLNQAVKVGTRYASLHGQECTLDGNSCGGTVQQIAQQIANAAVGLPPQAFNVTLTSATAAAVTCAPLSSCLTNSAAWPPTPDNADGMDIQISAIYPFHSALSMFWPGSKAVAFSVVNFGAYSRQTIQF